MCLKRIHFSPATINENLANLESKFIANGGKWEEFKLTDLFNYARGTRLVKSNRIKGDLPLLTAGEFNQGVKEFISNTNQQIFSNAITIDMFCNSFVHIEKFCCDDNILVLNAKIPMNKYHLRFISTIINKDKSKYGYGKQYRIGSLENHIISLPTQEGKIAFDFMEKYIKELELERIKELEAYLSATGLKDYELTDKEKQTLNIFGNINSAQSLQWKEFRIGDLFEIVNLEKLNPLDTRQFRVKQQDESNPIPAIVAKVGDNGIMYYVGKNDFETTKNKLVVIADGAVASGLVYYQGQEFTILHNAYAIQLKYAKFETRQFICFYKLHYKKLFLIFLDMRISQLGIKSKNVYFNSPPTKTDKSPLILWNPSLARCKKKSSKV